MLLKIKIKQADILVFLHVNCIHLTGVFSELFSVASLTVWHVIVVVPGSGLECGRMVGTGKNLNMDEISRQMPQPLLAIHFHLNGYHE